MKPWKGVVTLTKKILSKMPTENLEEGEKGMQV